MPSLTKQAPTMGRWTGILKVPLYTNNNSSTTYYRVAASLCLSPSSKSLSVPAANAIFFNGDKVDGTGNPVIERLSDLQKIAELLVTKFGNSINVWAVEAPVFNGSFAVYKDFIPLLNEYGDPKSYDADGFPASTSIVLLLWNCLKEAKNVISRGGKEPYEAEVSTSSSRTPRTLLLGFSKGGVVLNQLVTEFGFAPAESTEDVSLANKNVTNGGFAFLQQDQIIPNSKDGFLNSVAEFHYVDVGLNTEGAYVTNRDVIHRISERLVKGAPGVRFVLHGTPRQWCDWQRTWIRKEKDEFVRLLQGAARRNMGKLYIREILYFGNKLPSLQMHFEIIDHLVVC